MRRRDWSDARAWVPLNCEPEWAAEAATLALIAEVEGAMETEDLEEPEPTLRSRLPCSRPLG